MLSQYVKVGVHELDKEKLSPLLKLKYNNAIADAIADLGKPEEIGKRLRGLPKVSVRSRGVNWVSGGKATCRSAT